MRSLTMCAALLALGCSTAAQAGKPPEAPTIYAPNNQGIVSVGQTGGWECITPDPHPCKPKPLIQGGPTEGKWVAVPSCRATKAHPRPCRMDESTGLDWAWVPNGPPRHHKPTSIDAPGFSWWVCESLWDDQQQCWQFDPHDPPLALWQGEGQVNPDGFQPDGSLIVHGRIIIKNPKP